MFQSVLATISSPIADGKQYVALGGQLIADECDPVPLAEARPHSGQDHLHLEKISRHHLTAEAEVVYPRQERLPSAVARITQQRHSTYLGNGFDDQHSGHNGKAGKVSLQVDIGEADRLEADCPPPLLDLGYPVDQQEREAMRKHLLDSCRVHDHAPNSWDEAAARSASTSVPPPWVMASTIRRVEVMIAREPPLSKKLIADSTLGPMLPGGNSPASRYPFISSKLTRSSHRSSSVP